MGLLGARPKARENDVETVGSSLPAGRLDQLMTFVERAAQTAERVSAPELPPRIVPGEPAPVPASVDRAPHPLEPARVTPVPLSAPPLGQPGLLVEFPEPIVVLPAHGGGKRRAAPLLAS